MTGTTVAAALEAKAALDRRIAPRQPHSYHSSSGRSNSAIDQLSKIGTGLFLASAAIERNAKEQLKAQGITHVLQVGVELSPNHPDDFTYMRVDILDSEDQDLVKVLPACLEFVQRGKDAGGVLVHCAAGMSRSPSVVIAYLMWAQRVPLADARAHVKAMRPVVAINHAFALQLQMFGEAGCTADGWKGWSFGRYMEARTHESSIPLPPPGQL